MVNKKEHPLKRLLAIMLATPLACNSVASWEESLPRDVVHIQAGTAKQQVRQLAHPRIFGLISTDDLEHFGCRVTPGLGTYDVQSNLLIGTTYTFALRSNSGCVIQVSNMVQRSNGYDAGLWAGIRASMSILARRRGWDKAGWRGEIGEYSEIFEFTERGNPRGFSYVVQKDGVMYTLTILSSTIMPSSEVERVILDNISTFDR